MKDISLHLLDIAQNSMVVNSTVVKIVIDIDYNNDSIYLEVTDNGKGMSEDFVKRVADPFTTTRTTRKVGLGIPLLKMNAERTGGYLNINSVLGKGTTVVAVLKPSNIDCLPLGDIGGTVAMIICSNPDIDVQFKYSINGKSFEISTNEIKEVLEGVPLNDASVYAPIMQLIKSNISELEE